MAGVADRSGEGDGVAGPGLRRPSTGNRAAKTTTPNIANAIAVAMSRLATHERTPGRMPEDIATAHLTIRGLIR